MICVYVCLLCMYVCDICYCMFVSLYVCQVCMFVLHVLLYVCVCVFVCLLGMYVCVCIHHALHPPSQVEYFNNFLMDINRPGLPEMAPQGGRTSTFRNQQVNPNFNQRRSQPMQPPQRNPMIRQFTTPRGDMWRPRMDRRLDSRPIICYNDLDAPMD